MSWKYHVMEKKIGAHMTDNVLKQLDINFSKHLVPTFEQNRVWYIIFTFKLLQNFLSLLQHRMKPWDFVKWNKFLLHEILPICSNLWNPVVSFQAKNIKTKLVCYLLTQPGEWQLFANSRWSMSNNTSRMPYHRSYIEQVLIECPKSIK